MANSHRASLNELLQSISGSCAKYVYENKEKITDMTEEEITTAFMEVMDAPRVPMTGIGMSGLAPSLSSVQPVAPKVAKTRTVKSTKEVPPQLWIEADEYKRRSDEGQKICAYLCERSAQENKKNRVCGAKCEDTDIGDSTDPFEWRCVSCKGKSSNLKKKLDGNKKPSPKTAVPGVNVVNPIPSLPSKPQPMTNGIGMFGNMSVPGMPSLPMPSFGGLPGAPVPAPMPSLPEQPVIPKSITPKRPSPKKLEPVPVLASPDTSEDEAPAPAPTPEPIPVKEEEESEPMPAKLDWLPVSGLATYYTTNYPGFKKVLFKFDTANSKMYSVGRINGDINESANKNLVQLNDKETKFVSETMKCTYSFEGTMNSIPSLPSIPSIPGLPSLP
jgi:hypothetical protein